MKAMKILALLALSVALNGCNLGAATKEAAPEFKLPTGAQFLAMELTQNGRFTVSYYNPETKKCVISLIKENQDEVILAMVPNCNPLQKVLSVQ